MFQLGFWRMIPNVCKKYNVKYDCVKHCITGMWVVTVGDSIAVHRSKKQASIKANWKFMHPANAKAESHQTENDHEKH
jgi:hypothetical protein